MRWSTPGSLIILASLTGLVAPATGYAARRVPARITTQLYVDLDVDGIPVLIDGTINVTELRARHDRLSASATLVGQVTLGEVTQPLNVSLRRVEASVAATCGSTPSLTVILHELELKVRNIPLTLRDVALTVASPPNTLVGTLTCSISSLLTQPRALQEVVTLVNRVLTVLLDGGVVSLVASVHLNQFSLASGNLIADATITGTLTVNDLAGGTRLQLPIDASAFLDATVVGECTADSASLSVTLNELHVGAVGILDLTLVDTTLIIDSGGDPARHTLICAVTPLLEEPVLDESQLIPLLNQILALL